MSAPRPYETDLFSSTKLRSCSMLRSISLYKQNCSTYFFHVVPTLCLGTLYICKLEDMKVLLDQFTRLIDSLQSPGLRIYSAVNVIPKERNISITSGYKRVGRWCMATYNVHKSLQYQALALRPLVPLFALLALLFPIR